MEKYQPLACQFYDVLELHASRRVICTITFFATPKSTETVESRIHDIFTKNKEEFIRIDKGREIRLDQIISINDNQFYGSCGF